MSFEQVKPEAEKCRLCKQLFGQGCLKCGICSSCDVFPSANPVLHRDVKNATKCFVVHFVTRHTVTTARECLSVAYVNK